jgi:hypothetical protein
MANVKFYSGEKDKISSAIESNKIQAGGVIFTSDTDELIIVNDDKEERIIKSKSQKPYTLLGTSVGALEAGDTIPAGISIDELLTMLTQKRIAATYKAPTATIATVAGGNTSGNYEVGTQITYKKQANFTQNDAGAATTYTFNYNGTPIDSTYVTGNQVEYTKVLETNSRIGVSIAYEDGPIKKDNFGDDSPTGQIKAGTVTAYDAYYNAFRKGFYNTGLGDLPEFTSASIRASQYWALGTIKGTTKTITLNEGQQYVYFAVPTSSPATKVMYVETNDTGLLGNFDQTTVNVEGANNYTAAEYIVYSYRLAVPAAATMTFQITF